ncbi:MAG: lytic transglycosylase domain-containing protein [Paludibacteraceae bacterium]|nr:lytic transglycosylase domain-containing protein [Paludibacteraceae bacterium]
MYKKFLPLYVGITLSMPLEACASNERKAQQQELQPSAPIAQLADNNNLFIPQVPAEAEWCGEKVKIDNEYFRERLDRELMNFTYSHSSTLQLLKRANRYFPLIERILKEEGLPDDIKYLAAIESSLNPRSYSSAKAAGLWQLIPEAGKDHGLQVDENVDERYHIELSTRAACKYLRHAYQQLGNWSLTAASYNAGIGRLLRQSRVQLASNFYEMNLTEETNRYMFRLLACKMVMTNPKAFGFNLKESELYREVPCDTVGVDTAITNLAQFAKDRGLNYNLLKEENFWLRTNTLPNPKGKHYVIKLPIIKKD